jgi:hypothetical protein
MSYTAADGRAQLLDTLGGAIDRLGFALASLGEAYEALDEHAGDRLEVDLFRPVQLAYGRAKRTYTSFAERYDLPAGSFEASHAPNVRAGHAQDAIESALTAVAQADGALATLQDSMLPIEVGDEDVRAGLTEVRALVGGLPDRARDLVRTLGR